MLQRIYYHQFLGLNLIANLSRKLRDSYQVIRVTAEEPVSWLSL